MRVPRRRLCVTEHARKATDLGASGKGARAITSDHKAAYLRVVFEATNRGENFLGDAVINSIERLWTANGDQFHVADIIKKHVAMKLLVLAERSARLRQARPLTLQMRDDTVNLVIADAAHDVEWAFLETKRQPATEFEIGGLADLAVENVNRLRNKDAEHAIAYVGLDVWLDRNGFSHRGRVPVLHRVENRSRPIMLTLFVCLQVICLNNDRITVREIEYKEGASMHEFERGGIDLGCGRFV